MNEQEIKARYRQIWPAHVSALTWFLIECRRDFGGDLDAMLVLMVVGGAGLPASRPDLEAASESRPYAINLQSISDYTAIPRETVRRKLAELARRGWIERNDSGAWIATPKAAEELSTLTKTGVRYLARLSKQLAKG
jgi:hypothetical protein